MMKVFFEVEIGENNYMGFDDLMNNVDHDEQLKSELLTKKYHGSAGQFGRVIVQFYQHTFTIKDEIITSILINSYISPATNILKNEKCQNTLEYAFPDTIVFDYIDSGEVGVRIRHYSHKDYYNDAEEIVFVSSTNYMVQEIIVPKKEFIEQTIICSEQYFEYSDKLKFPNPHPHYEYWRTKLKDLREQFAQSPLFTQ